MFSLSRELLALVSVAVFMAAFFASFFFIGDFVEIIYSMTILAGGLIVSVIIADGV